MNTPKGLIDTRVVGYFNTPFPSSDRSFKLNFNRTRPVRLLSRQTLYVKRGCDGLCNWLGQQINDPYELTLAPGLGLSLAVSKKETVGAQYAVSGKIFSG